VRCPHCGEPVKASQERCFACGQAVRTRRGLDRERPFDPRILLLAGGALLLVLVGLVIMTLVRPRSGGQPARPRAVSRDTTRKPAPDTTTRAGSPDLVARATRRFDKIQQRYEQIKGQVLGEQPTPEQRDLMAQIDGELRRARSLAGGLSGSLTSEQNEQLDRDISSSERELNNLISKFTRAPKNR
jgi:hypothetical protein